MPRPSRYAPDTLPRPRHWVDDAACRDAPTEAFFPTGSAVYAKSFCAGCPVVSTCLAYALRHREHYGVWGGLDEDERADLLRRARLEAERQRRQERQKEKARAGAAT